jgi:phage-related protein
MDAREKVLTWLHGEVKTPPFSSGARVEAGLLLRRLQRGQRLTMPHSKPLPEVGAGCHELRIPDEDANWRILYHVDTDAIVILEVFDKRTRKTPQKVLDTSRRRLRAYRAVAGPE